MTTSENDSEALSAIRMANETLKKMNKTWEEILNNEISKKSFLDLTDKQIEKFLLKQSRDGNPKERMMANLFVAMEKNGTFSKESRIKMDEIWQLV